MTLFDDIELLEDSPPSDLDLAMDLYERIASAADDEFMLYTAIPGTPPSKARPRFRRNGFSYTDPKSRAAETATADHLRGLVDEPYTGNVALGCIFFRSDRQRIDTDNMLKHVCDAANTILWNDDSQVTALLGITEFDPVSPRTLVVVGRHLSTMGRGTDDLIVCRVCGLEFLNQPPAGRRKTCSKTCAMKARGAQLLDELVPCAYCEAPFKRINQYQKLCSAACRRDSLRDLNRSRGKPKSRCIDCDVELAHHRGGRCRGCWRVHVRGEA